ncbi:MAG: HNH endonuclease [Tissierellales bacterium]|nr:HNH endonuclease [Tissierellales bacterium]
MRATLCTKKAREHLKPSVRRKLLQDSGFACSICGNIPVVFHHIEEWAENFSNDEKYLIPICDKCHRRIHGEGGTIFSKDELYQYKRKPKKPKIISDQIPFEAKKHYSFFVGNNFVMNGERTSMFRIHENYPLISIDTSSGELKLTILSDVQNEKPIYLISDNELLIQAEDIWDMKYSGNSLKIWKILSGKKEIFVELIIKPDIIILKEMNTFIGKNTFSIQKQRKPKKIQVDKISMEVRRCEEIFKEYASVIDSQPPISDVYKGIDIDSVLKKVTKDRLKMDILQYLYHDFYKKFRWPWHYYMYVLDGELRKFGIFYEQKQNQENIDSTQREIENYINRIKERYKEEFKQLENVIVTNNGVIWSGNIEVQL